MVRYRSGIGSPICNGVWMDITTGTQGISEHNTSGWDMDLPISGQPHPLVELDPGGRIQKWPADLSSMLGIADADMSGSEFMDLIVPEDQISFDNALEDSRTKSSITPVALEFLSIKSGIHPVELIIIPFNDKDGTIRVKIAVIDLMQQVQLRKALDLSQKALSGSEDFISDFMDLTTREIRQPLTTLLLNLEMLDGGFFGDVTGKQREKFEEMIRSIDRMKDILNDATDTVKNIRQKKELHLEPARMSKMVNTALEVWKDVLYEKAISIQIVNEMEIEPEIICDRFFLVQSISSIIRASLDMSPCNGTIVLSINRSGKSVMLSISDMGDGIPRQELDRMFERFGMNDAQGRIPQALGLYMAKRMIDGHGGRIWCESYIGLGSTFIIDLPIRDKER